MILAVFAVGGIFLGAVTIGGLLMASQLRQAADFRASTNAIAAADAGIEWALYCYTYFDKGRIICPSQSTVLNFFSNSLPGAAATAEVTCYDADDNALSCESTSTARILSRGTFGSASRVFEIPDVQSFAPR